jgi:hypothetical protein
MRARFLSLAAITAVAVAVVWVWPAAVAGQAQTGQSRPAARTAAAKTFRTPEGYPDLQGLWNAATLTPLERPDPTKLVMTDAEAAAIEKTAEARRERASQPSRGDRDAPPVGGDGSTGAAGNVGGYNNFWIDNGTTVITVDGQRRTSIVIDPANGRVPPITADAMRRGRGGLATPTSDAPEQVAAGPRGAYDNPEQRPLAERCLLGFGSVSGPPALPVLYNNFKQIVQSKDYVMLLVEMNHDARIIPLNKPHAPASVRKWMGDSVARYEGDTLVIDTTNFTNKTRFRGSSENLHVIERLRRVDENTILYRFTVEDPGTWAQPWTGEYPWVAAEPDDHLYEYACHEGNYALGDILRGERLLEAEAEAARKQVR